MCLKPDQPLRSDWSVQQRAGFDYTLLTESAARWVQAEATFTMIDRRRQIQFGTDGWRAVIADAFTFENVGRVTQAYACFLKEQVAPASTAPIFVGFDNRFLSDAFAGRVASILLANGFPVALFEHPVPTPIVSFAVKTNGSPGGVMITASHNAAEYNGFKIKAPWGGSATDAITRAVEGFLDREAVPSLSGLLPSSPNGVEAAYRARIEALVDLERIRAAGLSVIIDSMHGSGGRMIESFLPGGRLKAETIRADRDVIFGGVAPEPIDCNLLPLKERVLAARASLGLVTDGDADRLGAVDELGQTMTLHAVVPILLAHLFKNRKMTGEVVFTVSQSVLMRRMCQAYNLRALETAVGFKYIAEQMLKGDVLIGAEESGGIGVKGHIPERDGILNALLLLEAVVVAGKKTSEIVADLHREFGAFYYERRDTRVQPEQGRRLIESLLAGPPKSLCGMKVKEVSGKDGVKFIFDDESWLMLRQSGTEPVLRLYVEASSKQKTAALLDEGVRDLVSRAAGISM